jgi:hypothetical protein
MADDLMARTLRERIAADLRPVRPLLQPWQRAAWLVPAGLLVLAYGPFVVYWVNTAVEQSPVLFWGTSLGQFALGMVLVGLGFSQVVPGRWRSVHATAAWLLGATGAVVALMSGMWLARPFSIPGTIWWPATRGCFRYAFLDGLPFLAVCLVLAARGLPDRPALAGGLLGLGAGLVSEAGWRLVCTVSQPSHALLGHHGGALGLALVGAIALSAWCRLRR